MPRKLRKTYRNLTSSAEPLTSSPLGWSRNPDSHTPTTHLKLERGIRLHIPALLSGGRLDTDSPLPPITLRDAIGDWHSTLGGGRVGFDVSCPVMLVILGGVLILSDIYGSDHTGGDSVGHLAPSLPYSRSNCHIDPAAATYRVLCSATHRLFVQPGDS